MPFLRNCWYVFGWSSELGDLPLARTIIGEPMVAYRPEGGGDAIILRDRCPHRFAPLSRGTVVGENLQCGYHGLQFDRMGGCVKNPFSKAVPRAAQVPSYVAVERDRAIWIWPGEREKADPSLIPSLPHHDDPELQCVFGLTLAQADYRLLSDNLMDLSHAAFLHPSFGGLDFNPKLKSWENEDGSITADFLVADMPNTIPGLGVDRIRNSERITWTAPGTHVLYTNIGPVEGDPTFYSPSAHLLTPETAASTHYFWSSAEPHGSMTDEEMHAFLTQAFDHEDKPMVEAVQQRMEGADFWDLDPVLLPNDAGAVRVRRKLDALIAAERRAAGMGTPSDEAVYAFGKDSAAA